MSTPPVPDPYAALGVQKDATAAQIKLLYRKLVLKHHPDKVQDESKKADAADEFHKVQQAYEILSDEDRRSKYDASVRLAELRREVLHRQSAAARPPSRSPSYDSPTSPRPTFVPSRSERYDRPRSYDQDDYYEPPTSRPASRRPSYVEKEPKKHSKSDSDRKAHSKSTEKSNRGEKKKHSEKDRKKERDTRSSQRVVPDNSDESDIEVPRTRPRSYEMPRERERERERERDREPLYSKKHDESSGSETEGSAGRSKMRNISNFAKDYITKAKNAAKVERGEERRSSLPLKHPVYDDLRSDHQTARRSSAHSPTLEKEHRRPDFSEKSRQNSAPAAQIKQDMWSHRPPPERSYTQPAEKSPVEKRPKPVGGKTSYYEVNNGSVSPTLRRGESDSAVHLERPQFDRPSLSRGPSKLKNTVYAHGYPTPAPDSPPKEHRSRHFDFDDDLDDRADSPRGSHRRRSSRSPPPPERSSRSRRNGTHPPAPPNITIPSPRTPVWAEDLTEEPEPRSARSSARPSPSRENSRDLLFNEILPSKESRTRDRHSSKQYKDTYAEEPALFVPGDTFVPSKMETGRSSRRGSVKPTRPPELRRNQTYDVSMDRHSRSPRVPSYG